MSSARRSDLVPAVAGLGVAEAGAGVGQQQAPNPLGVAAPEGQRQVAAEGQPADHGPLDAEVVEQGGEVVDDQVERVQIGVGGVTVAPWPRTSQVTTRQPAAARAPDRRVPHAQGER